MVGSEDGAFDGATLEDGIPDGFNVGAEEGTTDNDGNAEGSSVNVGVCEG